MALEEKLKQLEQRANDLKEEKIRVEEQLKNLRKQKDEIVTELAALGVTPKGLGEMIKELEAKIRTQLTDIDTQIPENIT